MTFTEFSKLLRKTDLGEIAEGGLAATLARARSVAQRKAPRKTGALASSIRSRLSRTGTTVSGGLLAGSARVPYAATHEFGATIAGAPWLKFRIGASWVQVRQVVIPARPYLRPALEESLADTLRREADRRLRAALGAR